MHVRTAEPSDSAIIAEILNRAYSDESEYITRPLETSSGVESGYGGRYLVACDADDKVRGCIYCWTERGVIKKLAIDKEYRGRGIGQMLMSAAEDEITKADFTAVRLSFLNIKPHLLDYFKKQGYRQTMRAEIDPQSLVEKSCFLYIMDKNLSCGWFSRIPFSWFRKPS